MPAVVVLCESSRRAEHLATHDAANLAAAMNSHQMGVPAALVLEELGAVPAAQGPRGLCSIP
jgi:hypothetical protein